MDKMKKVMILTDSCGLPRSFPEEAKTPYEKTYTGLLKQQFADVVFFQLSTGSATAVDLIGQALSYFDNWEPDFIILQAGMADCRPEPVSNFERLILTEFPSMHRLKSYIFRPMIMSRLIKWRGKYNVTPARFKRNIKKFKAVFPNSEILWLEIYTSASGEYENHRPGVVKRIADYNQIIKGILGSGFIPIQAELVSCNGIHTDHLHMNKNGHQKVYELLKKRLDAKFN
jgi:lysophospholipase L1-like esterase